jgi:hypothetical protein
VDYQEEKATLRDSVKGLEMDVVRLENSKRDAKQFIALIRQFTGITELDRKSLVALIDKITISEAPGSKGKVRKQAVQIHYKFAGVL